MESNQSDVVSNTIFLIEYEDEDGSRKRKRITNEQLQKLILFMGSHSDFAKGSTKVDAALELAWENLTKELNEVGPPFHTTKEWRTVWSRYKGNKKRKVTHTEQQTDTQMSLETYSREETVELTDVTPDAQSFLNDQLVNEKSEHGDNCGSNDKIKAVSKDELSDNRVVERLDKIINIVTQILETLVDVKNIVTHSV